jgi:hypothetical protein
MKRRPPMARRPRALPAKVDEIGRRIEHWRRTREKRTAMPEELWQEATTLARSHGVYQVSKALAVSYERLRERVDRREQDRKASAGNFVELDPLQTGGLSGLRRAVIELEKADGTRLTVQTSGAQLVDIEGLARVVLDS